MGPPLARPEYELPSYGLAFSVGITGAMLVLIFATSIIVALLERKPFSFGLWNLVAASETAAWRLKWFAAPLAAFSLWVGARVCAKVRHEPQRFTGLRLARAGFIMSALIAILITISISVTIPERLRQRQLAREAAHSALLYAFDRAVLEYRARYGSYPAIIKDLQRLPDPDGSIAALLTQLNLSTYSAKVDIAASLPPTNNKSRALSGAPMRLRPISVRTNTDDAPDERLPFTNYELIWPGEDKIIGTPDDRIIRDGMLVPLQQSSPQSRQRVSSATDTDKP